MKWFSYVWLVVGCFTSTAVAAPSDVPAVPTELHQPTIQTTTRSALPIFYVEPDDIYYVIRGRPVTLTCGASPAVQISVTCAGRWVEPNRLINLDTVDAATGTRYLRTSVDVTKDEVERLLIGDDDGASRNEFECECLALNSIPVVQTARSKKAKFRLAYLRKRFEQEPLNTAVEMLSPVQLQCLPPGGQPAPQVFWLKNGEQIDVTHDTNFIISNDGNLIISQARLTDSGNYTCGAQNIAGRRLSESAQLTVYVTGSWSEWTPWTECSVRCSRGIQRRSRTCVYPVLLDATGHPGSGGLPCPGDSVQRAPCTTSCPVDGSWSDWSAWSVCGSDCRRFRRRLCNNPAAENGGRGCDGADVQTVVCHTESQCVDSNQRGGSASDGNSTNNAHLTIDEVHRYDVIKYIGVTIGCGAFITLVGLVACLTRRQLQRPLGLVGKQSVKLTQGLMAPDLTHPVVVVACGNNNGCSPSDSPMSSVTDAGRNCGNGSQRLLLSSDRAPVLPPGGRHSVSYEQCCQPTDERQWPADNGDDDDTATVVWSRVNHCGGCLRLPRTDVSLTIPEGAVPYGEEREIFLTVSHDDKDRPKQTDMKTMLSGVIVCGPSAVQFNKPVVLSFPHCASDVTSHWSWSAIFSPLTSDETPTWQTAYSPECDVTWPSMFVHVNDVRCHVMTDMLGRFSLVGEPSTLGLCQAAKMLRLAVFVPQVPASVDYNIRVYFVEDTNDAVEGIVQVETQLGGCLLDKSKQILFQSDGTNLCLSVDSIGYGWRLKQSAGHQEIPFRHIWNGTQSGLHCSFALEHVNPQRHLSCDVIVSQTGHPGNRRVINIAHDITANPQVVPSSPVHYSMCTAVNSVCVQRDAFRLSQTAKRQLCSLIERRSQSSSCGSIWQTIADQLGVNSNLTFFATRAHPAEQILDMWEVLCHDRTYVVDLVSVLWSVGLSEAAELVASELDSH